MSNTPRPKTEPIDNTEIIDMVEEPTSGTWSKDVNQTGARTAEPQQRPQPNVGRTTYSGQGAPFQGRGFSGYQQYPTAPRSGRRGLGCSTFMLLLVLSMCCIISRLCSLFSSGVGSY